MPVTLQNSVTIVAARFEILTLVWWRFKSSGMWCCVN